MKWQTPPPVKLRGNSVYKKRLEKPKPKIEKDEKVERKIGAYNLQNP